MGIKLPFGRYSLQSSNVETDAAREARDDAGPKEQSNRYETTLSLQPPQLRIFTVHA